MADAASSNPVEALSAWMKKRGIFHVKRLTVKGASGRSYALDILAFTEKGMVPVVYVGSKLGRAALVKVESMLRDIGVRSAGIIVDEANSEDLAKSISIGVDVFTLQGLNLLLLLAANGLDAVFLVPEPRLLGDAKQLAEARCTGRIKRLLGRSRVEAGSCTYIPFYVYEASASEGRQLFLAVSGLSGGVLYLEKGHLGEALLRALHLPPSLAHVYSKLRGKRVRKFDFMRIWGRKLWNEMLSVGGELGLARLEMGSELVIEDDLPRLEVVEAAAETLLSPATRSPASDCIVKLPIISPGLAASSLYKLAGLKASSFSLVFAPVYAARLADEVCGITLWPGGPLTYKPLPEHVLDKG